MWHMPGHTYSRLKRYHDAVWQQEASARVDHAHMMRDRVLPDQIHNFAHNNEWLIRNLIHIGRAQDAIDLAKNMIDLPRHPKYNTLKKRGSANYGRMRLIGSLQSFQMWDEVLNIANTRYLETTGEEKDDLERQTLIGVAKFQTGDVMGGCDVLTEMMQSHQKLEQEQKAKGDEAAQKAREDKKDDKAIDKARKDAERTFDSRLRNLSKGIRELKGQLHLAFRAYEDALAEFEKVTGFDKGELARIQVLAGQTKKGLETIKKHVEKSEKETIPLAQSVAVNWLAGEKEKAKESFESLREISSAVDLQAPIFAQLAPIAKELGFENDWKLPREIPEDFGERPTLDSLGPFRWSPSPAKPWSLADHLGKEFSLNDYAGKPVIVIFYLGYGCLHCAEQLQAFAPMTEKFNEAGIDVVAISTDNKEDLKISHENYQEGKFPFPLVANPELDVFKAYRCYDDFENQTLHGTFLINPEGLVLWQDISYEPFMEAEFLLKEAKRLLAPATTKRETLQTNVAPPSDADAGE